MPLTHSEVLLETTYDEIDIVMKEFNVTPKMMDESIESFRKWIQMQPHLNHIKIHTKILRRFLLCTNYQMERAKERFENFYTAKTRIPEIFENFDPWHPEVILGHDIIQWCTLPKKTPENYRISTFGFQDSNAELFQGCLAMKVGFMIADVRLKYDTHSGDVFILDCAEATLLHILKLTPLIKQVLFVIQDCYGSKIKGIHIINCPSYAHNAITVLKSVLKDKIAKRIHVHKNVEDLEKFIPLDILPEDLGGKEKSRRTIHAEWKATMKTLEWRNWFLDSQADKADLSKKPNDTKIKEDNYLGIQGSFRTLCVD